MSLQTDWLKTELEESISLPEDSPVRISPSQEIEPACQVSAAASGPSYSELSLKFDPVGQSLRMSLGLELSGLIECSLTWQEQATPLGRWWWVLSMPELLTDGNGFGLLPTPNVPNGGRSIGHAEMKGRTAYHNGKKVQVGLESLAKLGMLPTPMARDWRSGHISKETHDRNARPLNEAVSTGTGQGHLSPCFVEWMMGYPAGWTDASG